MSKQTAAKKARRKKRQTTRNANWLPDEVHAEVEAVGRIAGEILPRGWVFDSEYSNDEYLIWYYPPSGFESTEDDPRELVTRIWVADPDQPQLILVGTEEDGAIYSFTLEQLMANLDVIEAYRVGDPTPQF